MSGQQLATSTCVIIRQQTQVRLIDSCQAVWCVEDLADNPVAVLETREQAKAFCEAIERSALEWEDSDRASEAVGLRDATMQDDPVRGFRWFVSRVPLYVKQGTQ